jgi:hypothetical protein
MTKAIHDMKWFNQNQIFLNYSSFFDKLTKYCSHFQQLV